MSTFLVEQAERHHRMIADLKQQCCALIEDVCHKAEILENIAAEPWESPSENPPPKDGAWILAVFKHKFHPDGLPVVVKWGKWELKYEVLPDGTEIPTDEIIEGWTLAGGFPGDMVTGEPVAWAWINMPNRRLETT